MNVIAKGTILFYIEKFHKAKTPLLGWYKEFEKQNFANFNQLKEVYKSASLVAQNRVVFNIKGNDYRLVVSINFSKQAAYVIWFGNHAEYDKINVETISFDFNKAISKKL